MPVYAKSMLSRKERELKDEVEQDRTTATITVTDGSGQVLVVVAEAQDCCCKHGHIEVRQVKEVQGGKLLWHGPGCG